MFSIRRRHGTAQFAKRISNLAIGVIPCSLVFDKKVYVNDNSDDAYDDDDDEEDVER